jgi:hypothetical protein
MAAEISISGLLPSSLCCDDKAIGAPRSLTAVKPIVQSTDRIGDLGTKRGRSQAQGATEKAAHTDDAPRNTPSQAGSLAAPGTMFCAALALSLLANHDAATQTVY